MKTNLKLDKKHSIVLVVITLFAMTSCGKRVYTSGTYGSIKTYTAKPEYRGENASATYVSADFSAGSQHRAAPEDINGEDKKTLISLQAHRSITRKYFNFYYGLGGTFGNYKFSTPIDTNVDPSSKAFYNLNAKTGINLNLPTKRMDWRVLGVELGYHYEFGPYQNLLAKVKRETTSTSLLIFNKKSMLSYNINSEAVFKFNNGNAFGLGFYVGDILNKTDDLKGVSSEFLGVFLSYKFKKFTFSFIKESGKEDINSSKFGLTYQLF